MKVVSVYDGFEEAFWNHANQDPLDYYFFIMDLKQHREKTQILMAIEKETVEGLALLYSGEIVQLRGSRKAVELLLDSVDLEKVELQAPAPCRDLVLKKYKPQIVHDLVLMHLRRGEENIQVKHVPERLTVEDAEEVARVLREADPEWWGEITAERQRAGFENAYWLGIKRDNKLVSIGLTRFMDFGSNIGAIATDRNSRNQGFATSIVSALVQEILKHSPSALIHVLKDNIPAVKVYSTVGFKPYKEYLLMRADRIKS